ncbi:MAG: tRNA (adenosine(37)-N6)-dimethylallyltransferase MiaA [Clostridiales bacterium]|nr:tRNA (adenosine(37)-N6)-dimethylallyltransferase MiaA [Clostridiales bacterium]
MYDSIIIIGATATGKTDISIKLAKKLSTEVINADSMYIYKNLNIGTAKPTEEEMAGVKHHLISIVEEKDSFNVSEYRELAKAKIEQFRSRELTPIIVGGTGFYIDSLIKNYSYGETGSNNELREQLQADLDKYGKEYIYKQLEALDPVSASKLHINDTVRVIRAIEIAKSSSRSKSEIINNECPILQKPLLIGLNTDREVLYDRINRRVDIMLKNGLIDEVKSLYDQGYTPEECQCMKGIGYKEIVDYLRGNTTLDDSIEKIKQHTRNYAKRQITWFKRNKDIIWFDSVKTDKDEIVNEIIKLYNI